MKASLPYNRVKEGNGDVLEKMIFMPVVNLQKDDAEAVIDEYLHNMRPKAFELVFTDDTPEVRQLIKKVRDSGSKVFINTLWPELCGGHDDNRAVELRQPEESWGWIVKQGTKLMQTDRPQLLLGYIGAGVQDIMSGILIEGHKQVMQNGTEVYDFTYINWFWIGAAALSLLLILLVWKLRPQKDTACQA